MRSHQDYSAWNEFIAQSSAPTFFVPDERDYSGSDNMMSGLQMGLGRMTIR
jgi:hypothetical protein